MGKIGLYFTINNIFSGIIVHNKFGITGIFIPGMILRTEFFFLLLFLMLTFTGVLYYKKDRLFPMFRSEYWIFVSKLK